MRQLLLLTLALFCLGFDLSAQAQDHFTRGEVVLSGYKSTFVDPEGVVEYIANLRLHSGDGSFARELATSTVRLFREPLVLNDTVFVGMRLPEAIERFSADGTPLPSFTTEVARVNYLSPGTNGGVIAANVSGEVYVLAADGTLLVFRDFLSSPSVYGGIDLGPDGCTLFFATDAYIGRWNICTNTPAVLFGSDLHASLNAFRVLPNGTFLVAGVFDEGWRVLHVAADGSTILRRYHIPANALALDVDGTSFWTNAGNYLLKVDIASGTILSETYTEFLIEGISVVGEPRAALAAAGINEVPTLSASACVALILIVASTAVLRLRT